jgi:putative phage-type endonuclease
MVKKVEYKSKEWYEMRKDHIGASESGAILGLSKFMSNIDLWEQKVGLKEPKDLSDNEAVTYGIKAEEHLAKLFELDFPQYEFINTKDIVLVSDEHPFIMASPDGLLVDKKTNEKGIFENKTTIDIGGKAKQEWKVDKIPNNYYCQLLHTFLCDNTLKFAVIKCQIKYITENGENCFCETLHRKLYRKDCEEDIEILKNEEIKFWEYVKSKERPPFKLNF